MEMVWSECKCKCEGEVRCLETLAVPSDKGMGSFSKEKEKEYALSNQSLKSSSCGGSFLDGG